MAKLKMDIGSFWPEMDVICNFQYVTDDGKITHEASLDLTLEDAEKLIDKLNKAIAKAKELQEDYDKDITLPILK